MTSRLRSRILDTWPPIPQQKVLLHLPRRRLGPQEQFRWEIPPVLFLQQLFPASASSIHLCDFLFPPAQTAPVLPLMDLFWTFPKYPPRLSRASNTYRPNMSSWNSVLGIQYPLTSCP